MSNNKKPTTEEEDEQALQVRDNLPAGDPWRRAPQSPIALCITTGPTQQNERRHQWARARRSSGWLLMPKRQSSRVRDPVYVCTLKKIRELDKLVKRIRHKRYLAQRAVRPACSGGS